MGIKGLFPYLMEAAPKAIQDSELKRYTGRRLAVDASAWMYQFLSIVRTGAAAENLQNDQGEATSHLQGFVLRALKMLEAGIQPVFVFDGKPPEMKTAVNRARHEARSAAKQEHAAAVASGASSDQVYKAASRSTLVTKQHNQHTKELLHSMGLPVVEAESEAEATCAQLCREGQVYAAVTEDMDVLTFGAPRQVKNLFDVEGSRTRQPKPAREVDLSLVQDALSYSQEQFIEFCILCGCDYLPHLPRIGPKTAAQLLQREGSLDAAVAACRAGKGPKGCTIPEDWDWVAAKRIFQKGAELPELSVVATSAADCEKLRSLLVEKHQFNPSRVGNMVDRLWKVRQPGGPVLQRRLDSFFQSSPKRPRREKCTSAPKEPIDVEKWRCPQCTFENDSLPFCEMCEKPRPAQPNASERLRPSSVCIDLD